MPFCLCAAKGAKTEPWPAPLAEGYESCDPDVGVCSLWLRSFAEDRVVEIQREALERLFEQSKQPAENAK
jgi:hypothetical protein